MSYQSKYTGAEVEALLDKVGTLEVPEVDLSGYATETWVTTQLEEKQDAISDLDTIRQNAALGATALQSVPSEYITETELVEKGYAKDTDLARVAKSGSYDDLNDTPTIPSKVSELTNDSGFTTNTGTVTSVTAGDGLEGGTITGEGTISLPSVVEAGTTGIATSIEGLLPSSSAFIDTAYSEGTVVGAITVDKHGRVTGVKECVIRMANSFPGYANDNIGGLITAADKVKLDGIIKGCNVQAVDTNESVEDPDMLDYLVVGVQSLTDEEQAQVKENLGIKDTLVEDHGTEDTTFALTPNVFHVWGEVTELSLTLEEPSDTSVYNEYMFQFTSGATATTLALPDTIEWVSTPSIEADTTYQCSIVNNIGIIVGV